MHYQVLNYQENKFMPIRSIETLSTMPRPQSKVIIRLNINQEIVELSIETNSFHCLKRNTFQDISGCLPSKLNITNTLYFDQLYNYLIIVPYRLDKTPKYNTKVEIIVRVLVRVAMKLDVK